MALAFFSRKYFLAALGSPFLGLSGTLSNLLALLNLAELGVGTVTASLLYRPLLEKNHSQINGIIAMVGRQYRRIGLAIALTGIVLAGALPLIFPATGLSMPVIFFAYFSLLAGSLIGYFFNYQQVLLDADQRNYVITAWFQSSLIVKVLLQIAILRLTHSLYAWIFIELLAAIVQSILLHWRIRRTYPWLNTNNAPLLDSDQRKDATRKLKQVAIHRLADFSLYSTKDLFIYAFSSLTIVAYYGNYMAIIWRLNQLVLKLFTSMQASIGSLVAEHNIPKAVRIFWEVIALRYFAISVFVYVQYHIMSPFITLWLGTQYVLPMGMLGLILCNIFLMEARSTVINFLQAYGLFADVWAPITEAGLHLLLSGVLGYCFGVNGVLAASALSLFAISYCWKPFYLFRRGFMLPVNSFWINISKYHLSIAAAWFLADRLLAALPLPPPANGFPALLLYGACTTGIYAVVLATLLAPLKGAQALGRRLICMIHKPKNATP